MSNPIFRIQKASKKSNLTNDPPYFLSIIWGKLTITKLYNEGEQLWSLLPASTPDQTGGFWIINTNTNLALKYNLDTGEVFPAPLDKKEMSFVWSVNYLQVWRNQIDYSFSPIRHPDRRMTAEVVEVPTTSNSTIYDVMYIRLVGDAGSPANQAWDLKPDVTSSLNPEKPFINSSLHVVGAY
ncbi:5040_t:CDS:1 [Ambispora leptoticha]|uniref:5040_t:CDS:1 n=1 Tax=Ambispora leptoticha TaxID=144679 RepID=A0A9N8VEL2_9GLOM|nr:5040_t:CDS:1 [Ambispora leptoticha]